MILLAGAITAAVGSDHLYCHAADKQTLVLLSKIEIVIEISATK